MNYLYRITYRKVYCIRYSTSDLQSLIASYQRSSMISTLIVSKTKGYMLIAKKYRIVIIFQENIVDVDNYEMDVNKMQLH
jgi:hypothetical protein